MLLFVKSVTIKCFLNLEKNSFACISIKKIIENYSFRRNNLNLKQFLTTPNMSDNFDLVGITKIFFFYN